jgi:hypothetical protein
MIHGDNGSLETFCTLPPRAKARPDGVRSGCEVFAEGRTGCGIWGDGYDGGLGGEQYDCDGRVGETGEKEVGQLGEETKRGKERRRVGEVGV